MFNPWLFLVGILLVAQSSWAAFSAPCASCNGAQARMTQAQPGLPVFQDVSQILNYPSSGLVQVPEVTASMRQEMPWQYNGYSHEMALPGAYAPVTPSFQFSPEKLTWSPWPSEYF